MWPLFWLYEAWSFALGPDPGKVLMDRLGLGTLILLLITLGMTPLQKLSGWAGWIAVRRQLGLWCFAYVVLHLAAYCVFILGLDWSQLGVELRKRPYIIVGALGLGLLHMLWIVRADLKEWAIYAFIGGLLLVLRIPPVTRRIPRLIAKKSSSATKA